MDAALAASRPLLLRGQPGTGKSQIAEAVAAALDWPLVVHAVDARTEPRDLLFEIDFVQRLGEAQLRGAVGNVQPKEMEELLSLSNFTRPGVLWWAFDWGGANKLRMAEAPDVPDSGEWKPGRGVVVLIDEIDKAETHVANGLLEALAQLQFRGPDGKPVVNQGEPPLILITTNEERELPDAFLRRCFVHWLELPNKKDRFLEFLQVRGELHFPKCELLRDAAEMLWADRSKIDPGEPQPGLAEYLDLLRVLDHSGTSVATQKDLLKQTQRFVFGKFRRPAESPSAGEQE